MMRNKGFTLIELLTTIVILAVIALIAIPLILNIVDKSKRGAFADTAYGLMKSFEYSLLNNSETLEFSEIVINYNDGKESASIPNFKLNYKGKKPLNGSIIMTSDRKFIISIHNGEYCAEKGADEKRVRVTDKTVVDCAIEGIDEPIEYDKKEFSYTGSVQEFTPEISGYYTIELWGAAGGMGRQNNSLVHPGGNGAYTKGSVYLEKDQPIYIYIGGKGANAPSASTGGSGGFNGGGKGGNDTTDDDASGGGGGATDIRLVGGAWNNLESLRSRIMVAAGGAGSTYGSVGGAGGSLTSTSICHSNGATQTTGGNFGIGQNGKNYDKTPSSGAGGGYYGGVSTHNGTADGCQSATGGSSFISGYSGADAILEDGTHNGQPVHFSGIEFVNAVIIPGDQYMPSPVDGSYIIGNPGNGYVEVSNGTNLSVNGPLYIELELGDTYIDQGATAVNFYGHDITSNIISTGTVNPYVAGTYEIVYAVYDPITDITETISRVVYVKPVISNFAHTGSYQTFTVPKDGKYLFELWGASGGKGRQNNVLVHNGGSGSYVKGEIYLEEGQEFYVYVGGKGADSPSAKNGGSGGFNGGAKGGNDSQDDEGTGGGGGATDIRLVDGAWNNAASLRSRIIVAAGGAGSTYGSVGGAGGTLTSDPICFSNGATQTSGHSFGGGQAGTNYTYTPSSGAGGGYYGGRSQHNGTSNGCQSATGGSSFISGHTGTDAISEDGIHTGQPVHYSGIEFTNTEMIDGKDVMPHFNGGNVVGRIGNGYARITLISVNP